MDPHHHIPDMIELDSHGADQNLLFELGKLYESIVIIQWPTQNRFNTSAMGVRFGKNRDMFLNPYPDTDTFELLMNPKVRKITINFTDDVVIFAKAALTGLHAGSEIEEINHSQLDLREGFAFLKNSQIEILGEIEKRNQDLIVSGDTSIQNLRNRGTTQFFAKFLVKPVKIYQSPKLAQMVNRGDNLALEAIVYASKLPAYQKQNKSLIEIQKLLEKVGELQFDIRRFSASHRALITCDIIDEYITRSLLHDH